MEQGHPFRRKAKDIKYRSMWNDLVDKLREWNKKLKSASIESSKHSVLFVIGSLAIVFVIAGVCILAMAMFMLGAVMIDAVEGLGSMLSTAAAYKLQELWATFIIIVKWSCGILAAGLSVFYGTKMLGVIMWFIYEVGKDVRYKYKGWK